jgi:hypothetical protein
VVRNSTGSGSPFAAFGAPGRGTVGVAAETAIFDHCHARQQGRQGAGSGGFGRTTLAPDEHAPNAWVYGVQDQGAAHALLPDDGGEWINRRHSSNLKWLV